MTVEFENLLLVENAETVTLRFTTTPFTYLVSHTLFAKGYN